MNVFLFVILAIEFLERTLTGIYKNFVKLVKEKIKLDLLVSFFFLKLIRQTT